MMIDRTERPLEVLLLTEGTYPFHWGGVSTWCHLLIRDLPQVRFTLFGIAADPRLKSQFTLPDNVVEFRPIPLWGIRGAMETWRGLTLREIWRRKRRTTDAVVAQNFIPSFSAFLRDLFIGASEPEQLGILIHRMYRFFQAYDFDTAMRARPTWESFVHVVQEYFPPAADRYGYPDATVSMAEVTLAMQWLHHWLIPIAAPVPRVDVAHTSTAGMCTMVGVVAKLEHGAGFMLSEHGVYLRERYLAEASSTGSFFHKLFNLRFARRMTDLTYAMADQISPCCDYNQRWELRNGAPLECLRTIYYGADGGQFAPAGKPVGEPPVVVWVGRINPLKDLITLLRAAGIVRQSRPDIQFRLYGGSGPEEKQYHAECLALHAELGLEGTVVFAGHTSKPGDAYNEGDVVVLSSISEGFPFATLEAMLCGKAVVATSVGGLPEQIEGCGVAVEPRNPEEMAQAILTLMNDPEHCAALGHAAHEKAVQEFSMRQSGEAHLSSYERLAGRHRHYLREISEPVADLAVDGLGLHPYDRASQSNEFVRHDVFLEAARASSGGGSRHVATRQDMLLERAVGSLATGNGHIPATAPGLQLQLAIRSTPILDDDPRLPPIGQRKRRIAPPNDQRPWMVRDSAALHALANQVRQRDPLPIDYLEVTAVLESLGITDEVATNRYGAPHTFGLAEVVLDVVRAQRPPLNARAASAAPAAEDTRRQALLDYARGPLALLPGLALLLIIEAYRWLSGWEAHTLMALSVGFTSAMLLTNVFTQGIMSRGSLYLGINNLRAARQYLGRGLLFAGANLLGAVALTVLVTGWLGVLTLGDRLIFALAFMALATIWLISSALVFQRAQAWLSVALGAGLIVGFTADRLAAPFFAWHLLLGSAGGYAVTIGVIVYALRWIFGPKASGPATKPDKVALPPASFLLYEAAPYSAYALLYILLLMVPHAIGWFGALAPGQNRLWAIFSIEGGYTLALPPLMLAAGVAERALRLFGTAAREIQATTDPHDAQRVGRSLRAFHRRHLRRYLVTLALISIAVYVVIRLALQTTLLRTWIGMDDASTLLSVAQAALATYSLLGWGMFNYMFIVSLGRPAIALRGPLLGIAVATVLGVPLSLGLHFSYSAVAFMAGGCAYCLASSIAINQMLQSADYYYYSAH